MEILVPTECPSCGSELETVNSQLFCRNSKSCPAQSTKRVQHFCKILKIKGFGEVTVNKLEISHINELLTLTEEFCKTKGIGDKTSSNLVAQIQDRLNKKIYVSDFISGMSIPLVGTSLAKRLGSIKIDDLTYESIREVGGGDKAANNLMAWIETDWIPELQTEWDQYLVTEKTVSNTVQQKGVVCITGKLNDFPNRNAAATHLASLGWEVKSSVTKTTQYLVCEDDSKTGSSSYKKAEKLGLPIVTIKELEDNY